MQKILIMKLQNSTSSVWVSPRAFLLKVLGLNLFGMKCHASDGGERGHPGSKRQGHKMVNKDVFGMYLRNMNTVPCIDQKLQSRLKLGTYRQTEI